ncbi:MAG: cyclic nucleotide-binding domain-containing protein [Acidobacteriota bacterium]|nr:cyclic nucleotide-binding domain-containing protein [Acidobacteriota bacterium]
MTDKTELRRLEQFRDRWSSLGLNNGLLAVSDRMTVAQLKEIDIFAEFKDIILEKIATDVSVATWREGAVLFEEGSYIDLAFYILEGEVEVTLEKTDTSHMTSSLPIFDTTRFSETQSIPPVQRTMMAPLSEMLDEPDVNVTRRVSRSEIAFLSTMDFDLEKGRGEILGPGEILGEIGALSGWPQSVTARVTSQAKLVQIRLPALRQLKQKSKTLKTRIEERYRSRTLMSQLQTTPLFAGCPEGFLSELAELVELVSSKPGEEIVKEGEQADALYLVRSGFVKLQQNFGESDIICSYLSKGMTFGQLELLMDGVDNWSATAVSVEHAELVKIPADIFRRILSTWPAVEGRLWETAASQVQDAGYNRRNIRNAEFEQASLDLGLLQGNSMLVIDLANCTRCDDCVRACAETHNGRARFIREGEKLGQFLITRSCYHCRDPVCLVGCPTGAIHRRGSSALVEIIDDVCIGCGTCGRNCPYDAIVMHDTQETWPDDMIPEGLRGRERKVASKCDLCLSRNHEPACVTNCPQGCAIRVNTLDDLRTLVENK